MAYLRILWEALEPIGFKASYQIILNNRIITLESKEFPTLISPIANIEKIYNITEINLYVPENMGNQMVSDGYGFDRLRCCVQYGKYNNSIAMAKDFSYPLNDS